MDTMQVAKRLTELCSKLEYRQAVEELYADDAVQIEAMEMPGTSGRETRGKDAILKMHDEMGEHQEIHGGTCGEPYPHDDQFICSMSIDVTHKDGPMKGQRMNAEEMCLYTVKDGKITEARFFYSM